MTEYAYDGWHKIELLEYRGKTIERINMLDGVMALMKDMNDNICLVKQYRPAADAFTLELPAGVLDKPHLSKTDTLMEEIEEECLLDRKYFDVSPHPYMKLRSVPGSLNGSISFYYVDADIENEPYAFIPNESDPDVDGIIWMPINDVLDMVLNSNDYSFEPSTVSAILMYDKLFKGEI